MSWIVEHYLVITRSVGGLGLFLLGMIVMTDGLRTMAGDAIRTALFRFTRSPLSGAFTGAVSTAILQSSSATTVAAVGFVAAGLLTFPEALGIVFGANIGTTMTGWLVALIGFKFQLNTILLPLIFIGALLKLFASNKLSALGLSIAGFGLIFVGISSLQEGMSGLQTAVDFTRLPGDTFGGRLFLVLIGVLFTVIIQSSSAGVAATLTALFSGLINFEQGAALVVGMNIGTTVTTAIATIGSSLAAKRTGYSHVIYNLFTSAGAFFLITPYALLCENLSPGILETNAEIALVAFHTGFNTLGVIMALPFTRGFARMMGKIIRGREDRIIEKLDKDFLDHPSLAIRTLQTVIIDELFELCNHVRWLISNGKEGLYTDLAQLQRTLDETQLYLDNIHFTAVDSSKRDSVLAMFHTLDHMQRLHERCDEEESRVIIARQTLELRKKCHLMDSSIEMSIRNIESGNFEEASKAMVELRESLHEEEDPYRATIMEAIANRELTVQEGTHRLEAIRWLRRVSHHLARIMQHLQTAEAEQVQ